MVERDFWVSWLKLLLLGPALIFVQDSKWMVGLMDGCGINLIIYVIILLTYDFISFFSNLPLSISVQWAAMCLI